VGGISTRGFQLTDIQAEIDRLAADLQERNYSSLNVVALQ
jgi:hypothetical protein